MKMSIVACLFLLLFTGCKENPEQKKSSTGKPVALPMKVSYPGTAEIGDMKNVQTVMEWNKRFSSMNFDVADLLADTVTFHLSDGTDMTASRDSTIAFLSAYAAETSQIDIDYIAAYPVSVPEQNHEWVFSWTDETYTMKNGNIEHNYYHEDYRLVDGKIREVFQYARKKSPSALAGK